MFRIILYGVLYFVVSMIAGFMPAITHEDQHLIAQCLEFSLLLAYAVQLEKRTFGKALFFGLSTMALAEVVDELLHNNNRLYWNDYVSIIAGAVVITVLYTLWNSSKRIS